MSRSPGSATSEGRSAALSAREREVLGLLADGMSGAAIAEHLVLSPETVRTHVRNAMAKLGASTRSQAIAIALQREELGAREPRADAPGDANPAGPPARSPARSAGSGNAAARRSLSSGGSDSTLQSLLLGLTSLPDVEGGAILVAEEEGLSLRRAAHVSAADHGDADVPDTVPLGEGPLGRVALERTASVLQLGSKDGRSRAPAIAAPMVAAGHIVGTICLVTRPSRPARQTDALLLQAFANRIAELLLVGGENMPKRLGQTLERFRLSWAVVAGQP